MAEAPAAFDMRRFFLLGGVLTVLIFSGIFFLSRGCMTASVKDSGYTTIYTNLDLKDAANVIARLKELNIPYEIREQGRVIAVPKDKSDAARLGLAEKNLPAGGVVGWEIFDASKLGATDFDRRIQLIRAISGELARTVRRIEGVEDARVQVVIPETKLFALTSSPVTASVMLRLRPLFDISPSKIKGIVYLVASSVENLQPENVTVVDESGKILSLNNKEAIIEEVLPTKPLAPIPVPNEQPKEVILEKMPQTIEAVVTEENKNWLSKIGINPKKEEKIKTEKVIATPETIANIKVPPKPKEIVPYISGSEKVRMRIQAKKELEQELSGRAQELVNRFYPINSIIVKVGVRLKPSKTIETDRKMLKVAKIYAVVLIDNRLALDNKLKKATYSTVAAAIGYNKARGDKIVLQKVPFHLATNNIGNQPAPKVNQPSKIGRIIAGIFTMPIILYGGIAIIVILIILVIVKAISGRGEKEFLPREEQSSQPNFAPAPAMNREKNPILEQVRGAAESNPQQVAELLKSWLTEK
ncbi:MAG: flagellar basal-body MS-ring/collar protein FliF [Candidatus Margulisiibacteriota bacterium]